MDETAAKPEDPLPPEPQPAPGHPRPEPGLGPEEADRLRQMGEELRSEFDPRP